MQRRKFLAGMGSLTAAAAAGIGTGAFTSVSASRSVSLETAADNDAYLAFTTEDAKNSGYVSNAAEGAVSFNLDGSDDTDGSGLNRNATTQINDIVRIQNQGTEPVLVYVPPSSIDDANSTWEGDSENLRIDPQATNRPHGDYEKEASGNLDGGVANDQISLTGGFTDPPYAYTAYGDDETDRKEEFLLDTGEELSFGLYVKTPDSSVDQDISMEIVADATPVTEDLLTDEE